MHEPRDPKGYTALINPVTGKMELALAVIPMQGDADYHPKNINDYVIPKDILPRPSHKWMDDRFPHQCDRFVDRKPQPWEQFVERKPEYWETVDQSEVTIVSNLKI